MALRIQSGLLLAIGSDRGWKAHRDQDEWSEIMQGACIRSTTNNSLGHVVDACNRLNIVTIFRCQRFDRPKADPQRFLMCSVRHSVPLCESVAVLLAAVCHK